MANNRPPSQTPQGDNKMTPSAAALKAGIEKLDVREPDGSFNYKKMLKSINKIEFGFKDINDPMLPSATLANASARRAERAIDRAKPIDHVTNAILDNIANLEALPSRNARAEAGALNSAGAPLLAEGKQRIQQKQAISAEVKTYVKDVKKNILAAIEAKNTGASPAEVQGMFANIKKQTKEVIDKIKDFDRNLDATVKNLNYFLNKTTFTLNNARKEAGLPPVEVPEVPRI